MGPKKKAQKDDDESTQKLFRIYRKKCEELGVNLSKLFREKVENALEADIPHLKKIIFWDQVGATGTQAIFEALCEQGGYKHLEKVTLSNVKTYDQGLKYVCKYMETAKSIKELQLEINEITEVGCRYLGEALAPSVNVPLVKLNLSFNRFGTQGLEMLATGLVMNQSIEHLSLNKCGIDAEGARFIQDILSFHQSKIQYLSLDGNLLRNQGIYQVFRALQANEALSELYLSNNQFGESQKIPVVEKICEVLSKNMTLIYVNLQGNGLYNDSASKFVTVMKTGENPHLLIEFGIMANKEVMADFKKLAKKRKKKKKKKKKKKGKKKKK